MCEEGTFLDDLVCSREHIRRNSQVNLLGGFQIDNELKFLRLLHWQVGGFSAFQDLVHIRSGAAGEVVVC
jgi:hypothetical protein